ncbi:hypothetical protein [Ekhidna sp.]|uniref:hypothetical protein n=1 Tax=Ekhidna sp. TaxID=2608089 RepID=UPI0032979478
MKINKKDLINHTIAFFGTIISIIVALQLDDWREKSELKERVEISLRSVDEEILRNQEMLQRVTSANQMYIDILEFINDHKVKERVILYEQNEIDNLDSELKQKFKLNRLSNNNGKITAKVEIRFDVILSYRLQRSNWEALKYTGYLNFTNQERIARYVNLYWLLDEFKGEYVKDFGEKLSAANSSEEMLMILKENLDRYQIILSYVNEFLADKSV